jgi:hypothetical protein
LVGVVYWIFSIVLATTISARATWNLEINHHFSDCWENSEEAAWKGTEDADERNP